MTPPLVRCFGGLDQLSRAAAEQFVALARVAIAARGRFVVALSGGSTPRRLFELLAASPFREQVDWSRVEFFWSDERAVLPDDRESNYRMAQEAFLGPLKMPAERVHRMKAEAADREAAARAYQAEIAAVFGVSPEGHAPAFDLILLGMGPDGHTASLFPHTAAVEETSRWVMPNFVPRLNAWRMTFTAPVLHRAAHVLFLIGGWDKAQPLAETLEGPFDDPRRLPCQLLKHAAGQVTYFVDVESASKLQRSLAPVAPKGTVKWAPSILSADFARLGEQVFEAEKAGADRIHVDVMDGHFVPNITIGPVIVKCLRPVTKLPLEVHLMIENPDQYLDAFAQAGADTLQVHVEGAIHLHRTIQHIKHLKKRAAVVLNPATPADAISEILPDVDEVLVMTVNPGFGGQAFIMQTLPKIQRIRQMIDRVKPGIELELDGGVDPATAPLAIAAGAGVLVAGSAIYGVRAGVASAMQALRASIEG